MKTVKEMFKEIKETVTVESIYVKELLPFMCSKVDTELDYAEKCHNLEEEIGCPLDVVFKALKNGIYTKENILNIELELFEVRGIEEKGLGVISNICAYAECDFTCYYKDYKKTWFLRKDKSE